ncbi:MAG TPA: hypothetical protein VKT78_02580 [Fimbriimonadaceae bacterium]|nr:hypothetical protein [Fimbriimonadaceae bacterium]
MRHLMTLALATAMLLAQSTSVEGRVNLASSQSTWVDLGWIAHDLPEPIPWNAHKGDPHADETTVEIISVNGSPYRFHGIFDGTNSEFLRTGYVNWGYGLIAHVVAKRGHLWQEREILKKGAQERHFELHLYPWPPGSNGKSSLWK